MATTKKSSGQARRKKNGGNGGSDKPTKKPLIIEYDQDGTRIGPDGYPMTPVRKRMHFLFNAAFVWGILCFVISLGLAVAAFAQGQEYSGEGIDFTFYGGTMMAGFELAFLLRIEALASLFTAIISILMSFQGYRWFYERKQALSTMVLSSILLTASIIYQFTAIAVVGCVDPLSLVTIVLVAAIWLTMRSIEKERPSLRKAKVAKTVLK